MISTIIDFFFEDKWIFSLIRDKKNFWAISILLSHRLFNSTILCYYINIFFVSGALVGIYDVWLWLKFIWLSFFSREIFILPKSCWMETHRWRSSGVFIVNFEHISHLFLEFLLLTLNMWLPTGKGIIWSEYSFSISIRT